MMFNERIKQLREERQMPQRKLAAAIDIDTASYCKMEKGERRARKEHITIIADLLQTEYGELLKLWLVDQVTAVVANDKELSSEVLEIAKNRIKIITAIGGEKELAVEASKIVKQNIK